MNNWQEWLCGTDPTNALSVLQLLPAAIVNINVTVTWQSVAGVNYFVQPGTKSQEPSTRWPNIPGQSPYSWIPTLRG